MKARRQERTKLIYHLRVFDARRKRLLGHMVDITPEGLMLIGENPLPVGRKLSLRMDLPRNLMVDTHLTFSAESKWCVKDQNGDFYSMGLRIVKITPEALSMVQKLAQDFYQEEIDSDPESDLNPPLEESLPSYLGKPPEALRFSRSARSGRSPACPRPRRPGGHQMHLRNLRCNFNLAPGAMPRVRLRTGARAPRRALRGPDPKSLGGRLLPPPTPVLALPRSMPECDRTAASHAGTAPLPLRWRR